MNQQANANQDEREKETHMCVACFVSALMPPAEQHLSFK